MVVKHVRNIMEPLWSKEDVKCKNFSTVYVSKIHRLFCIITSTATNKQQTTPKQLRTKITADNFDFPTLLCGC